MIQIANYLNAVTFFILGMTFYMMSKTVRLQGHKWWWLRVMSFVMWGIALLVLAFAVWVTVTVSS